MTVCQRRKYEQQLHKQPDRAEKGASSAFERGGDMKRTGLSNSGVNAIPAASPGTAVPRSDATMRSVCFYGLPHAFAPWRFFADKSTYLTESHHKTKLELQAAATLYDFDIDVMSKDVRVLQYPEPEVSKTMSEIKNRTRADGTGAGVDDGDCGGALLNATSTKCYGNAQLDQATMAHDPWDGLQHADYRPTVTMCAIMSVTESPPRELPSWRNNTWCE